MKNLFNLMGVICGLGLCISTAEARQVILNKDDVTSAVDIENAINTATQSGSEPGLVILDGSRGSFTYTGGDKSINIELSQFELRGINRATIANCDDGIFFNGGVAVSNIQIKGITFNCNGVAGTGIREGGPPSPRRNVIIKNNVFRVINSGILISKAINWTIANNTIQAGKDSGMSAIVLSSGSNSVIWHNRLSSFWGVWLTDNSTKNLVVSNSILAEESGVRLSAGASQNQAIANIICVSKSPGIFLDSTTFNNQVYVNLVYGPANLKIVEDMGTNNKVSGNLRLFTCRQ